MNNIENIQSVFFTEFGNYTLVLTSGTTFSVPICSGNREYEMIQEWIAAGNTVIPWQYAENLVAAKTKKIVVMKQKAKQLLSIDDWMTTREWESGEPMPLTIKTWRQTVRTESNTMETDINNLLTIEDVQNYAIVFSIKP